MQIEQELEKLTEAYLTQRLYAPRIQISNELKQAIQTEFEKLLADGKNPKRIVAAIEYEVKKLGGTRFKPQLSQTNTNQGE